MWIRTTPSPSCRSWSVILLHYSLAYSRCCQLLSFGFRQDLNQEELFSTMLGLSPDMGSLPSTIPSTDADELAALIISAFAKLTPEVTSVPLELTAAFFYSKCRAGITAYSTGNAVCPWSNRTRLI